MAGRKQEASSEGGCKEYRTKGEADGIEGESQIGRTCSRRAGQLAGVEDVVVTGEDAW